MKKIIVVEDNDLLRENICEILELEGYETHPAENGLIGWEKAQNLYPDLILSDVNMPEMDGLELLRTVREHDSFKNTPFIFLTVRNSMKELRMGMNYGADDYLAKPFDIDQLLNSVNSRLERKDQTTQESSKSIKNKITHQKAIEEHLLNPLQKLSNAGENITDNAQLGNTHDLVLLGKMVKETSRELEENLMKILTAMKLDQWEGGSFSSPFESTGQSSVDIERLIHQTISKHFSHDKSRIHMSLTTAKINVPKEPFSEAIRELLGNALKFSGFHRQVEITGMPAGEAYTLKIKNFGEPFPCEKFDEVRPYRTFEEQPDSEKGIGLGLSNAKRLLKLSNTTLAVHNETGPSTVFTLQLPAG